MTLPSTGVISASMVNVELRRAAGAAFSMNAGPERTLANKPSGVIRFSDFRGKTHIVREPETGQLYVWTYTYWAMARASSTDPTWRNGLIRWEGARVYDGGGTGDVHVDGTWTYYRGWVEENFGMTRAHGLHREGY